MGLSFCALAAICAIRAELARNFLIAARATILADTVLCKEALVVAELVILDEFPVERVNGVSRQPRLSPERETAGGAAGREPRQLAQLARCCE
eukprot:scaffold78508_cov23-Tisochrysis_lutea.AAC.1